MGWTWTWIWIEGRSVFGDKSKWDKTSQDESKEIDTTPMRVFSILQSWAIYIYRSRSCDAHHQFAEIYHSSYATLVSPLAIHSFTLFRH
jgi:hypothetical protein